MKKIYSFTENEFKLRCRKCLISFKNLCSFIAGFTILFLWAGLSASSQTITIDGNPDDWNYVTGLPTYTHVVDDWGKGTDNQFTKGSKDFMFASDLRWSVGQTSNKTDIANAAVVMIGCELFFAGDRLSTNGDANIGFWFFLNGTAPRINPVTGANDFYPEHVVGDILVIADFSKGGTVSTITVYKWVGTGGAFGGGTLDLVSDANATVAQNNVYSHPIPTGWSYITPNYPTNSFYEGMIDLCGLNLDNYCFSSFLLETRNSNSINAMLGDFVAGNFGAKPVITATGGQICEPGGIVELCAVSSDETLTYQWYTNPELTAMVGNTKCISVNVTSTTNYWVVATNDLNCTSDAVMVTATVFPSAPCTIEGSLVVCPNGEFTYMGPADMLSYNWSITGNATIEGAANTRMVTIKTGQNCDDFTLSLNTIDANGCTRNCQLVVNVNDIIKPVAANCPEPRDLGINPAAGTWGPSTIQWTDNCGVKNSGVTAGTVVSDECIRSITHTHWAEDYCGNREICEEVITWTVEYECEIAVDVAPLFGENAGQATVYVKVDGVIATNAFTYLWSHSGETTQTTYELTLSGALVTVTDEFGCETTCVVPATSAECLTLMAELGCNPVVPNGAKVIADAEAYYVLEYGGTFTVTNPVMTNETLGCLSEQTWTFVVEDEFGNIEDCEITYTWKTDLILPVIAAAPANLTVSCIEDVPAMVSLAWTDNCDAGGTVMGVDGPLVGGECGGTITRTWNVMDECGNAAITRTQVITVDDNTIPVLAAAPANVTVSCIEDVPPMVSLAWTDNCDAGGTVLGVDGPLVGGECGGTITRTWNVMDVCGNAAVTRTQVITVDDNTIPVLAAAPANVTVSCIEDVPAMVSLAWTDNCDAGGTVLGVDGPLVGGECGGTITRTWNIMDACGNAAVTRTQVITVDDNTIPVLAAAPANVTVSCIEDVPAMTSLAWSDNCDAGGTVMGVDGPLVGGECGGTITRTWNITDECGNAAVTRTQVITVDDNTIPVLAAAPANVTVECIEDVPPMVSLAWSDNCDAGGTVLGVDGPLVGGECGGTITRTWNVMDDCDNAAVTRTQVITVNDTTDPVIQAPADYIICMDPLPLTLDATWTDNCSAGGSLTATGVLFSETECTTVYAYTFTATDDCGNTATKTVYVTRETEVYENCETMFARYDVNSTCFLADDFNRWGWTTKFSPRAEPYTLKLYAGAAQCDITKGTEVGIVIITYYGGNLKVEYVMHDGYTMTEAHVYVGCDPYPTLSKGQTTVAPGQYTFNGNGLDNLSGMTVNFTNVTGDIYIIVHGVSCEVKCSCTESNGSGDGVKIFDPVNLGITCQPAIVAAGSNEKSSFLMISDQLDKSDLKVYPNPFNDRVTFEFVSGSNTSARLEIFDMLGQRITTLMDHQVKMDVLNSVEFKPENLAPGVLLYRLTLGEDIINGKLLYNK